MRFCMMRKPRHKSSSDFDLWRLYYVIDLHQRSILLRDRLVLVGEHQVGEILTRSAQRFIRTGDANISSARRRLTVGIAECKDVVIPLLTGSIHQIPDVDRFDLHFRNRLHNPACDIKPIASGVAHFQRLSKMTHPMCPGTAKNSIDDPDEQHSRGRDPEHLPGRKHPYLTSFFAPSISSLTGEVVGAVVSGVWRCSVKLNPYSGEGFKLVMNAWMVLYFGSSLDLTIPL